MEEQPRSVRLGRKVYLVDQVTADNKVYHKACFRCHHCKGTLKLFNYSSFEGVLYCMPHFDQLFKMTGSLDKSFEGAPKTVRERSVDQVAVDGTLYHKSCFRCMHGGCVVSPSNYVAHEQRIYCKHHHAQLFREKGNFSQFD